MYANLIVIMKFTVAIPAYKGKFLKECIESVLAQSYKDFELIVVDDASPDNLAEIAGSFDDPRLSYHRNKTNCGAVDVVDNWNKCLAMAKGEYICLMGDDDTMADDYLMEMHRLTLKYPEADALHGRTLETDETGKPTILYQAWPEHQSVYDLIWHRISRLRVTFISDFVFRTSTLRAAGGYYKLPLAWGSDDITSYIAASKSGIASTNKVVFHYRRNGLSITQSGNAMHKINAISAEGQWLQAFISNSRPKSDEDRLLASMIAGHIPAHIGYRKAMVVCQLVRAKRYGELLSILCKAKKLALSPKQILRGILMAWGN